MKYDKFDRDTLRFLFNDEVLESLDRRLCGLIVPSDDNSRIEKIKGLSKEEFPIDDCFGHRLLGVVIDTDYDQNVVMFMNKDYLYEITSSDDVMLDIEYDGEDFFIVPKPVGESCLENI